MTEDKTYKQINKFNNNNKIIIRGDSTKNLHIFSGMPSPSYKETNKLQMDK